MNKKGKTRSFLNDQRLTGIVSVTSESVHPESRTMSFGDFYPEPVY